MTNEKAIKALEQIKTYVTPNSLDELDYALEVLKKLDAEGIKEPLKTDFTKLQKIDCRVKPDNDKKGTQK